MANDQYQEFHLPIQAVWLTKRDIIELNVMVRKKFDPEATRKESVTVHVGLGERIVAITVPDSKRLRLGQWLRKHWTMTTAPTGTPQVRVFYDEPGRLVHLAFDDLELLDKEYVRRILRKGELRFTADGELCAIRIPVTTRRWRDGDLSASAGYLPAR